MAKKKHNTLISRRFYSGDISKWQELAKQRDASLAKESSEELKEKQVLTT